jgi:hypothetical protein
MQRKQLRVRDLISDVRSPDEAPKTYAELQSAKGAPSPNALKNARP